MAVYRNEYPLNVFSGENTYTPPSVPSHIPISLEPVVGAPSDGELESAHGAVRTLENLANSPFFDSVFSAKLSQHVFNIQFARYIQDSNQGSFTQGLTNPPPPPQTNDNEPPVVTSTHISDIPNRRDADPIELDSSTPLTSQAVPPALNYVTPESTSVAQPNDKLDQINATQQETNRLLGKSGEVLRVIERTLFSSYFHAHRTANNSWRTLNEKGELAWMHKLPYVSASWNGVKASLDGTISEQNLATYLRFYNIAADLVDNETGNLKPDKKDDARDRLADYLAFGYSR
ncbi:hypothetical protein FRC11_013204 [Ceratobasidium sp. 423]|nr:hypothetical protein FRC11_013204 [Ceratobasidium sp. 423]